MKTRFWTMHDLDAIAAIEKESFPDPWNRRMLADSFLSENFRGVLLEEGDTVTAYGGMSITLDEAEILLVATAEMFRRCGRGSEIMDALLCEAKKAGVKHVFLEVRVSNAPAQLLYLKKGFVGIYCRTRYYPDGEDAIVMKKEMD